MYENNWPKPKAIKCADPTWDFKNIESLTTRKVEITKGAPLDPQPFPKPLPTVTSNEASWTNHPSSLTYSVERVVPGQTFNITPKVVAYPAMYVYTAPKRDEFVWNLERQTLVYFPKEEDATEIDVCNFQVDFIARVIVHTSPDKQTSKFLCRLLIGLPSGDTEKVEILLSNENLRDAKFFEVNVPLAFVEKTSRNLLAKYIYRMFSKSFRQLEEQHRYEFVGWYLDPDTKLWRFLTADQKDVSGCWKLKYNPVAASKFLQYYFDGISKNKGVILLLYIVYSLIREFFVITGIKSLMRSVLAIVADTNTGKTCLATTLTAPIWTSPDRDCMISFLSSLAYIENDLTNCNGFWGIVDDFRPIFNKEGQKLQKEKFDLLCRFAGDQTMPGKCTGPGRSGKQAKLKCGVITTHEFLPTTNNSTLLRLLPLELSKSEINLDNLGILQNDPEVVASFYGCFIRYIEYNQKMLLEQLPSMQEESTNILKRWLETDFDNKNLDPRRISDLSTMLTVGDILLNYIGNNPSTITRSLIHDSIKTFTGQLLKTYSPVDIVEEIKTHLKESIADGRLKFTSSTYEFQHRSYHGYRCGNEFFVVKNSFITWLDGIKTIGLGSSELITILKSKGFLSSTDSKGKDLRFTTDRNVDNENYFLDEECRKQSLRKNKKGELEYKETARPYLLKFTLEDN